MTDRGRRLSLPRKHVLKTTLKTATKRVLKDGALHSLVLRVQYSLTKSYVRSQDKAVYRMVCNICVTKSCLEFEILFVLLQLDLSIYLAAFVRSCLHTKAELDMLISSLLGLSEWLDTILNQKRGPNLIRQTVFSYCK